MVAAIFIIEYLVQLVWDGHLALGNTRDHEWKAGLSLMVASTLGCLRESDLLSRVTDPST